MVKSSIEEESADSTLADKSGASVASGSLSGETSADMDDNTASSLPIDADAIETIDTEDDEGIKSEENGEINPEKQPLRGDMDKAGPSSSADNIDEEMGSKDDLDSDSQIAQKKGWDVRCVVVGILVVLIMVGGATAAILVHRFKAKPSYDFRFANYYGSHMVLQRAPHRAVVWGYGPILEENTTVTLLLEGGENYKKEYTTTVANKAPGQIWKFILDQMSDPGPFMLTARLVGQEGHVAVIKDVLFGDVWMCAGSSNMQYSVDLLDNAKEEIDSAGNYTDIRLFSVFPATADFPRYDLREIQLFWSTPSKDSLVGPLSSPTQPGVQLKMHFSALCWLYGKEMHKRLNYPIGLITAVYANSHIYEWASSNVIDKCDPPFEYTASNLWNAMINPLLDLSIYGLIWDVGEMEAGEMSVEVPTKDYNCALVMLFKEWRRELYQHTQYSTDHEFPIGIVQLGPNRTGEMRTYGSTELRWQQTANYGYLPNPLLNKTFMAVSVDLPDLNTTLPSNVLHRHKRIVADRLVKGSLAVAYRQRDEIYQGPFPAGYRVSQADRTMVLNFSGTEGIINRDIDGFEICCSTNSTLHCVYSYIEASYAPGRKWVQTPIVDHTDNSVKLDWSVCRAHEQNYAVGIRYAWRETPCLLLKCAIYGKTSRLPMAPYIRMDLKNDGLFHEIDKSQINFL